VTKEISDKIIEVPPRDPSQLAHAPEDILEKPQKTTEEIFKIYNKEDMDHANEDTREETMIKDITEDISHIKEDTNTKIELLEVNKCQTNEESAKHSDAKNEEKQEQPAKPVNSEFINLTPSATKKE
jgi:hypothetical protein